MSGATQAPRLLAGANSMFTGDELLTAAIGDDDNDSAVFAKSGLMALKGEKPFRQARSRAFKMVEAAE